MGASQEALGEMGRVIEYVRHQNGKETTGGGRDRRAGQEETGEEPGRRVKRNRVRSAVVKPVTLRIHS